MNYKKHCSFWQAFFRTMFENIFDVLLADVTDYFRKGACLEDETGGGAGQRQGRSFSRQIHETLVVGGS
jgi:hypothetical protein